MAEDTGLTDEERAELEQLRAEKAARQQAERDAAERAELERLRAQRATDEAERAARAREAQARERGRALMEPDEDDLRMPLGQKIVILAIVGVAAVWLAVTILG
ncbi:MAG TPA: hypothetical protein IAA42_06315 [Candidatus Olsenella excrementavium]|uniref:Uncharacterized protein n=1 Tax=Candidatus Olsenella excrementavium TaxID=2838709 RepID=A0A9D1ZBC5_9ACTN|nr:hypothetical protein [Candidatus Olsenella excrementavium]